MPYILENMVVDDISEVARIERLCFSMPWPVSTYRRELKTPETNRYIVIRYVPPEDSARLGLKPPTVENLTALTHPEMQSTKVHDAGADSADGAGRSLLSCFLPELGPTENGR